MGMWKGCGWGRCTNHAPGLRSKQLKSATTLCERVILAFATRSKRRSHAYSKTTKRDTELSTALPLLCRTDVHPKKSPKSAQSHPQAHPARRQTMSLQPIQQRHQGPMHHKRKIVNDKQRRQIECKVLDAPDEVFVHTRSVFCPGCLIADLMSRLLVQRVRRRALAEEEVRLALGEVEDRLREDGVCPGEPGSYE